MAENKAGSDKKNMIHDALILFAITLVSGLLLGLVYQVTAEPERCSRKRRSRKPARRFLPRRSVLKNWRIPRGRN